MSKYLYQYKPQGATISVLYAWFEAMHTRIDMVVCDLMELKSIELCDRAYEEIQRISSVMNRFDPASELSNLNLCASTQYIKVSDDLFHVIKYAKESFSKTNGSFDITVQSKNDFTGGIDCIEMVEKYRSIRYSHPDVQIDLGGIAKGYALDRVVKIMLGNEVEHFLLNFGNSSIASHGNNPTGKGWKISLKDGGESYELHDEFLTVSGNNTGERKHILNPQTRKYVEGKMELAVVTSTGIEGEVLSTTKCILPLR